MTFPVVGSNVPLPYTISNSLRFNDGDSPRLDRTNVSSPTDSKIFTYSVWLKKTSIGSNFTILDARSGSNRTQILFRSGSNEALRIVETSNSFSTFDTHITTNALYRDVSAWYHLVIKYDSTNATANNRCLFYINGVEQSLSITTSVSLNYTTPINEGSYAFYLGHADGAEPYDGYIAEANFIDGQALSPTDFGEFDLDSGIWKPKQYEGTYGTNGFYLKFANSGNMGEDSSGNDNTFTPTNLSGTTDVTTDTPTNNFATLNPLNGIGTFSEGNVKYNTGISGSRSSTSTIGVSSGKWYSEVKITSSNGNETIGIVSDTYNSLISGSRPYSHSDSVAYFSSDGSKFINGTNSSYGASFTTNDIIGIALNLDDDEITFYKNGASQGTITTKTFDDNTNYLIAIGNGSSGSSPTVELNTGNPSYSISSGNTDDNGYGNFEYAPPSGFLALCTQNLATALSPTIDDGSQYFNPVLYTGTGSARDVTGFGFQPDWLWLKQRSGTTYHRVYDSSRGAGKEVYPNATDAEYNGISDQMSAFISDGFSVPTSGGNYTNINTATYVAWGWKANGGTTSSNTDGSITSTVQANTTAGFSIVTYTGNGTSGATVGHGLGKAPSMYVVKKRNNTANWDMYHIGNDATAPETKHIYLNSTDAVFDNVNRWNDTAPTSSVFSLGDSLGVNGSSDTFVAYCFAEIEGYSSFGSYTGNGSSDGTFVYTGFRPSFVIIKRTDSTSSWSMRDTVRSPYNVVTNRLWADLTNAESTSTTETIDILSNGFKARNDVAGINASGGTYIYMAFAENPFVTSGAVPVTAR